MSSLSLVVAASVAMVSSPVAPPTPRDKAILDSQNAERSRVGVMPLSWSPKLAEGARAWAEELARTKTFEHSRPEADADDLGENLWMGTKGAYSPQQMVDSWIEERSQFKLGLFPAVSTSGNWVDVGHYTQLIWHSSKEVGCAIAANQSDEFLVCRYFPPGNWIGQNPLGRPLPKGKKAATIRK